MTERTSGREPALFSREFSAELNMVISESDHKVTGQGIAAALNRRDAYVSDRRNGKASWTVDDVDVIAGLIGTTGLELLALVSKRMTPATVTPIKPKPVPSTPRRTVRDTKKLVAKRSKETAGASEFDDD